VGIRTPTAAKGPETAGTWGRGEGAPRASPPPLRAPPSPLLRSEAPPTPIAQLETVRAPVAEADPGHETEVPSDNCDPLHPPFSGPNLIRDGMVLILVSGASCGVRCSTCVRAQTGKGGGWGNKAAHNV